LGARALLLWAQAEKRRHADLQAAADKAKAAKDPAAAAAAARRKWWGEQQYQEREERRQKAEDGGADDEDDDIAYYRCVGGWVRVVAGVGLRIGVGTGSLRCFGGRWLGCGWAVRMTASPTTIGCV
jgi:hypothetical protein